MQWRDVNHYAETLTDHKLMSIIYEALVVAICGFYLFNNVPYCILLSKLTMSIINNLHFCLNICSLH